MAKRNASAGEVTVEWATIDISHEHLQTHLTRRFAGCLLQHLRCEHAVSASPQFEVGYTDVSKALQQCEPLLTDWNSNTYKFVFLISDLKLAGNWLHEAFRDKFGYDYHFFSCNLGQFRATIGKDKEQRTIEQFKNCCSTPTFRSLVVRTPPPSPSHDDDDRDERAPSASVLPPAPGSDQYHLLYTNIHGACEGVVHVIDQDRAVVLCDLGAGPQRVPVRTGDNELKQTGVSSDMRVRFKQNEPVVFHVAPDQKASWVTPARLVKTSSGRCVFVHEKYAFVSAPQVSVDSVYISSRRLMHLMPPGVDDCRAVLRLDDQVEFRAIPNKGEGTKTYKALHVRPLIQKQFEFEQACANRYPVERPTTMARAINRPVEADADRVRDADEDRLDRDLQLAMQLSVKEEENRLAKIKLNEDWERQLMADSKPPPVVPSSNMQHLPIYDSSPEPPAYLPPTHTQPMYSPVGQPLNKYQPMQTPTLPSLSSLVAPSSALIVSAPTSINTKAMASEGLPPPVVPPPNMPIYDSPQPSPPTYVQPTLASHTLPMAFPLSQPQAVNTLYPSSVPPPSAPVVAPSAASSAAGPVVDLAAEEARLEKELAMYHRLLGQAKMMLQQNGLVQTTQQMFPKLADKLFAPDSQI